MSKNHNVQTPHSFLSTGCTFTSVWHCRIWVPGGVVCYWWYALLLWSQLSAGHSLGPGFWDICSPFLWSFWPHGVHGAPDRERLSVCHQFPNNCSHSWILQTKLLTYCRFFPAWCRSTILFLVSFDSSLVLAIVEFGVWLFEVVDRCLLYW